MKDNSKFEDVIRKDLDVRASDRTYNLMRDTVLDAHGQSKQKPSAARLTITGRTIMKNLITKLATAALIIAAIMVGIYALTGSGTSITIAQVRQAMENIDWMQIVSKTEGESAWLSFASKVEILINSNGRIVYSDFKTRKKLLWNPGSKDIYESSIDEGHNRGQFLGGTSGPFELFNNLFGYLHEDGYKVAKELGTYQGQKVEVWTARRVREKAGLTQTETVTAYIDVDKKLPIAVTENKVKGPDGDILRFQEIEFKYPETGPADIYEAGAPRSAQIKPAPEGQASGENVPP